LIFRKNTEIKLLDSRKGDLFVGVQNINAKNENYTEVY